MPGEINEDYFWIGFVSFLFTALFLPNDRAFDWKIGVEACKFEVLTLSEFLPLCCSDYKSSLPSETVLSLLKGLEGFESL